jgi:hypothetical protein
MDHLKYSICIFYSAPTAPHHPTHAPGPTPGGGSSATMDEEDSESDYQPSKRYVNTDHMKIELCRHIIDSLHLLTFVFTDAEVFEFQFIGR